MKIIVQKTINIHVTTSNRNSDKIEVRNIIAMFAKGEAILHVILLLLLPFSMSTHVIV